MKKIVLYVSLFLLVMTAVCSLTIHGINGEGGNSSWEPKVAGEKKIEKIENNLSGFSETPALFCDGEELPFDREKNTFYLPLDMSEEKWEKLSFSAKSAEGNSTEVFFGADYRELSKQDLIQNGEGIPVWIATGREYGTYQLVFTGLPMVTFESTDFATEDGMSIFAFHLYDTDHSGKNSQSGKWVTTCYAAARLRGNTSLTYEKKSLRLYLKNQEEDGAFGKTNKNLLGLRDDDDWILNSLYADSSRIRDKLCIDLWNEVGASSNPYKQNFGTQAELVEVMIGGSYQGIYDLMVPIDRKQLGMETVSSQLEKEAETAGGNVESETEATTESTIESATGNTTESTTEAATGSVIERIYKKKYTASWSASDFVGPLPDPNAIDARGGFYLKGDTILQNEEEWAPLYQLASLIEGEDTAFAAEITQVADRQNLVENWLFYEAIGGFDNRNKNYYYVARNRDNQYYGYFIPWDLNISFGAVYAENEFYCVDSPESVTEAVAWEPGERLVFLDADDAAELAASTWKKWRGGAFSDEAVAQRIAALEHQVKDSGAFAREELRWPNGNESQDFSLLYEFATKRLQFVDERVDRLGQE